MIGVEKAMKIMKYFVICLVVIAVLAIISPLVIKSMFVEKCTLSPSDNIKIELNKFEKGMPDTLIELEYKLYIGNELIDNGLYVFYEISQSEIKKIKQKSWFELKYEQRDSNKYIYGFNWGELSIINEEKCMVSEFYNF